MYRVLTPSVRRERDERGAVAILVALSLTVILVIAAMVLDFGLIRIDRQVDRSAADAATLAGLHGLNTGDGTPHPYVGVCTAIRYLKVNTPRFSGVDESTGWTNGIGGAAGNGCTDTALRNTTSRLRRTCCCCEASAYAAFWFTAAGRRSTPCFAASARSRNSATDSG